MIRKIELVFIAFLYVAMMTTCFVKGVPLGVTLSAMAVLAIFTVAVLAIVAIWRGVEDRHRKRD